MVNAIILTSSNAAMWGDKKIDLNWETFTLPEDWADVNAKDDVRELAAQSHADNSKTITRHV